MIDKQAIADAIGKEAVECVQAVQYSGGEFRALIRPCVYLFLRNGKPLYVGVSQHGISRPAALYHNHRTARDAADEVLLLFFGSAYSAKDAEQRLIEALKPPFNGTTSSCVVLRDDSGRFLECIKHAGGGEGEPHKAAVA